MGTAVGFSSGDDRYTVTTGAIPGAAQACTVTWWAKLSADRNYYTTMWGAVGAGPYMQVATLLDGVTPAVYISAGGDPTGTTPMEVGAWYRMAVTVTADSPGATQTVKLYYAKGTGGTLEESSATDVADMAVTTLFIGGINFSGEQFVGSLSNFKQWSRVLTPPEIEAELASYDILGSSDIVRAHKLIAPSTTDDSGNGHTMTAGATAPVTDPDGPPISTIVQLSGSASAAGSASGSVIRRRPMEGAAAAVSEASGLASARRGMSGAAGASATADASAMVARQISGFAHEVSTATGRAERRREISALARAASNAGGVLPTGIPDLRIRRYFSTATMPARRSYSKAES